MEHSLEKKLRIVNQLRSGHPLKTLCKEEHLDCQMVRNWLQRYEKYGVDGLAKRTKLHLFSPEEKEKIIIEHCEKGISLQQLSLEYNVDRSTIKSWLQIIRRGGSLYHVEQYLLKLPTHMARPKKKEPQTELEKLQYENLRLRAENALLKKVKALVEEEEARGRLNGQEPSAN